MKTLRSALPSFKRRFLKTCLSQKGSLSQRGALFGMDARVAIALFTVIASTAGALSYGKVNKARTSALIKEVQSVEEAFMQLQMDMNTFLPFALVSSGSDESFSSLWEMTTVKPGLHKYWNGPYFSDPSLKHKNYGYWGISYGQKDFSPCTENYADNCYLWITLEGVPFKTWNGINQHFDEAAGEFSEADGAKHALGKVRSTDEGEVRTLQYRTTVSRLKERSS